MVGAKIPCADPKTRFITKKTVRTASDRSAREASDSGAQGIKLPPAAGGSAPYGAIGVEAGRMYGRVKDNADSMMMAIVVKVGECTGFTVIYCPRIKQTSTPSGSQPLSLRASHLPLPQGTAVIKSRTYKTRKRSPATSRRGGCVRYHVYVIALRRITSARYPCSG